MQSGCDKLGVPLGLAPPSFVRSELSISTNYANDNMNDFINGLLALHYYATRGKNDKSRVQTRDLHPSAEIQRQQIDELRRRVNERERIRQLLYSDSYHRYYRRR